MSSPAPDWVVLGTPTTDGKVAIYASKDLTQAELQYEVEDDYDFLARTWRVQREHRRIELTVGMRTYTVVVADTYEQALRYLFGTWSPEPDQPAIEAPHRAISR